MFKKLNRESIEALIFWLIYHELIAVVISLFGGTNVLLWAQPFVVVMSVFMLAFTKGSNTKDE